MPLTEIVPTDVQTMEQTQSPVTLASTGEQTDSSQDESVTDVTIPAIETTPNSLVELLTLLTDLILNPDNAEDNEQTLADLLDQLLAGRIIGKE